MVWIGVTLCWALICADEHVEEKQLSTDRVRMREARGLLKPGGPGDVEVSDEPAEVQEDEKTKPKKKKTPEEIEAGKHGMGG